MYGTLRLTLWIITRAYMCYTNLFIDHATNLVTFIRYKLPPTSLAVQVLDNRAS